MGKSMVSVATTKDWEAENDASTLIQAAQIKRDAKRLAAAKKVLAEKAKATNEALKTTDGD